MQRLFLKSLVNLTGRRVSNGVWLIGQAVKLKYMFQALSVPSMWFLRRLVGFLKCFSGIFFFTI